MDAKILSYEKNYYNDMNFNRRLTFEMRLKLTLIQN